MKIRLCTFFFLLSALASAQTDSILSKVYPWKKPTKEIHKNIFSTRLFEGSTQDMSSLLMTDNVLAPSNEKIKLRVPGNEEHLVFLKQGSLTINIGDSEESIGTGSVALLMPGQEYFLQNINKDSCRFFLMKYRSKLPVDMARGKTAGGSLIKNWNKIEFKPHDRGGIRNFLERPTAMCKRLEVHLTTLNEGIRSHDPHKHRAAEIILVISNKTEMQIADQFYKGNAGDVYYLSSNVTHTIRNDGKGTCTYFAFQFE